MCATVVRPEGGIWSSVGHGTDRAADVDITGRSVRWTATIHSVLGFLHIAVVLAVTFEIITG